MKFYIARDERESTIEVYHTLREAKAKPDCHSVEMVEVGVTAENVRRLLGNCGGYAKASGVVWERPTS